MHPEVAFFQAFVLPRKRERYAELLNTKRGREKIRLSLDHFKDLDPRFCRKPPPAQQSTAAIVRTLKDLGAPEICYVMSGKRASTPGKHQACAILRNFISPAKLTFGGFTQIRGIRCVAALAG